MSHTSTLDTDNNLHNKGSYFKTLLSILGLEQNIVLDLLSSECHSNDFTKSARFTSENDFG